MPQKHSLINAHKNNCWRNFLRIDHYIQAACRRKQTNDRNIQIAELST